MATLRVYKQSNSKYVRNINKIIIKLYLIR